MKLIEDYKNTLQKIYDHVGFVEDWVICPINDCTDKFWSIHENDGEVKYADSEKQYHSDGDYYIDYIYTQDFYDKWIYRGKKFTMIFCDPRVDGMKWFRIFDNLKQIKNNETNNIYL